MYFGELADFVNSKYINQNMQLKKRKRKRIKLTKMKCFSTTSNFDIQLSVRSY